MCHVPDTYRDFYSEASAMNNVSLYLPWLFLIVLVFESIIVVIKGVVKWAFKDCIDKLTPNCPYSLDRKKQSYISENISSAFDITK